MFQRILRTTLLSISALAAVITAKAADPTATNYTFDQCRGSAMPYVAPDHPEIYPDTLRPLFINHVGRHGARFPASAKHSSTIKRALLKADSLGTITPAGRNLMKLVELVEHNSRGRWGALDSLGEAEQRGIASRMYRAFPELFNGQNVSAISSYSPRCIMSMFSFVHQLARLDNHINTTIGSGRRYSPLMRFFDNDAEYSDFTRADTWRKVYSDQIASAGAESILARVLGKQFPFGEINVADVVMAEYSTVSGTAAMQIESDPSEFFSLNEMNALWQCFNLRQYLLHSASTLSAVPAEIASPLLADLVNSADSTLSAIETGRNYSAVQLRFGHAETLMPLLSLMHVKGCYYLTNYFDTVGKNWCDFNIVPMAANLQMIFFEGPKERIYVKTMLNEHTISLLPDNTSEYQPWSEVRSQLLRCIPIYFQ